MLQEELAFYVCLAKPLSGHVSSSDCRLWWNGFEAVGANCSSCSWVTTMIISWILFVQRALFGYVPMCVTYPGFLYAYIIGPLKPRHTRRPTLLHRLQCLSPNPRIGCPLRSLAFRECLCFLFWWYFLFPPQLLSLCLRVLDCYWSRPIHVLALWSFKCLCVHDVFHWAFCKIGQNFVLGYCILSDNGFLPQMAVYVCIFW